jgi:hypothetical protein
LICCWYGRVVSRGDGWAGWCRVARPGSVVVFVCSHTCMPPHASFVGAASHHRSISAAEKVQGLAGYSFHDHDTPLQIISPDRPHHTVLLYLFNLVSAWLPPMLAYSITANEPRAGRHARAAANHVFCFGKKKNQICVVLKLRVA